MRLSDVLPRTFDEDAVYEAFGTWVESRGIALYPAQDEAILELVSGTNVILTTPTGSGKSLVATAAMATALARDECVVYTAPIKALVSEKFFDLCEIFGADDVGMVTGDAAVNADAPIICATAEVLANMALRDGADADIGVVIMDEFHYYADPDRGWAWQVPLLELPRAQFLLMSATLGDTTRLEAELARRTGRATAVVSSAERPVPLVSEYVTTPIQETIEELVSSGQAPVYVVHFTQAAALERAQALTSVKVASREERDEIAESIGDFRFRSGFGKTLSRLVRMGIGVHHAGMLPRYRRLVETLAQRGLLKVVCGTDTLGVGINVPIRTVLFSGLSKFDGVRQRTLQVREFQQIAGRAGRAGYDTVGYVVVEAPEHEIENLKALAKAGDDPKKRRKVQRKKAPEGFVSWNDSTFDRLVHGTPEPLVSRMRMTHSMVLDLLARPGDTEEAIERLITESDESEDGKEKLRREAAGIVEALLAGGVVERVDDGLALTVELPENFALNQPLSPFAVACFELLDRDSPTYALDVVSVIEATLEDPRPIISAQRFRARGEAVAELKADGVEYEERMELLEEVEHPQPLRDLLEDAYEMYRGGHPWVGEHELRPKSVVREMAERAMTFAELIADYGLARSEGVVLRYLSDAYRALVRTVPPGVVDEELADLVAWLGELVRQTDSSLLDEWEALVSGGEDPEVVRSQAEGVETPRPVTRNERAFRVLVRNAAFRRVELAARERWDALAELDPEVGWEEAMAGYFAEYDDLGTGPAARGPVFFRVEVERGRWRVRQTFDDPEGDHDWGFSAEVDLAASDEAGEAVLTVTSVGPFSS
ncbi:DEAD/DEAH box helicase [Aeromicrobium sp. PE09-221]|uniref:DEAD/DEAH box helicase n=1 Tax=Aeromicrobium sp. PE09-221 TaxID=1898043 RepID=UPI000B3E41D2|nr:DEAD/DEAH box helicase [Aeromicrobium sp. PE09-221]OUZ12901.1 DEAD/DEAH box helicase [Aeromicrobium sp. PE09-221]